MNCAIIGRGRWSKILQPYISKKFKIVSITGKNDTNIRKLAKKIDVFFVITPINTHFKIVKKCLKEKKHIFVEKPLATSYKECLILKKLAEKNGVILFTDYVDMYAPSRKIFLKNKLGNILHFFANTERKINNNSKENIFWKLHCHHLSTLLKFYPIEKLEFKNIFSNILIQGGINGIIYGKFSSKKNIKKINCYFEKGEIFIDQEKNLIAIIKKNWEYKKKYIDEKNNLKYSVKAFKKMIRNKKNDNIEYAIKITKIIEELIKNE